MRGYPRDAFDGRPVIGICNTWSELTPCNAHLREIAERVKRGVLEAGGLPLEFPVMSLGETNLRPTAMLFRNLASMDVEESIRGNPIDGVVLLCGCDKTTPSLVMGAASCDVPAIVVSGGPMLNGNFRGAHIGSGTAVWQMSDDVRAGKMTFADFMEAETCMSRSAGHCMTMGTASTMASMVEALGLGLPQNAAIPAVDSRRGVLAQQAGRRIVEMVREDLRHLAHSDRGSFENAIRVNAAIGGSTNAVIHLLAIAGRVGVELKLDDFDRLGHENSSVGESSAVGQIPDGGFLLRGRRSSGGPGIGRPDSSRGADGERQNDRREYGGRTLLESRSDPDGRGNLCLNSAGIAVLRGNLAPNGAVIKPSAATARLLKHRGRAVVFESIEDLRARMDRDDLAVDENSVMVLKGAGRGDIQGCRKSATCRFRASCWSRV